MLVDNSIIGKKHLDDIYYIYLLFKNNIHNKLTIPGILDLYESTHRLVLSIAKYDFYSPNYPKTI